MAAEGEARPIAQPPSSTGGPAPGVGFEGFGVSVLEQLAELVPLHGASRPGGAAAQMPHTSSLSRSRSDTSPLS